MRPRSIFRQSRRRLTAGLVTLAGHAAPRIPHRALDMLERLLATCGPHAPILASLVRRNMRAVGIDDRSAMREYFAQAALHLTNSLRILRLASDPAAVARLARQQVTLDASVEQITKLHQSGRGAVIAPAHSCNFMLGSIRLNQDFPVTAYHRWSPDRRKSALKETWTRAGGLRILLEPADAADPTSRAAACVEALRGGAVLGMTPDIPQKDAEGIAVRVFGRQMRLPTGPAALAMLAEVPMVPIFGRLRGGQYTIYAETPIDVIRLPRDEGGRQESIRRAMQRWADGFERFVRACPQAWFLWADSRWTKVFQEDARFVSPMMSSQNSVSGGLPLKEAIA